MRILIAGAGELGRLLASTLCTADHDVTIMDSDAGMLEHINDNLDIKVVEGSCVNIRTLKEAGIGNADALLAVSGDEAANILCCQLASKLGVHRTVCRVNSQDCFSEEDGVTPDKLGIWKCVSPSEECVGKIRSVLRNRLLVEKIRFSNPDAVMEVFRVTPSSLLAGTRVKDIPTDSGLLNSVRFAAIVRQKQFLIPHGDTIFVPGDKVYIAGSNRDVNNFITWISEESISVKASRIVISGATATGKLLASALCSSGYDVRFVEKNKQKGEKLLDTLPPGILVIHGDPTDEEVLEEAGIRDCEGFVSAAQDDEDNILSCIMAKRLGAKKTVAVTSKPEYIRIVPTMDMIDCGFSTTLTAVNSILRMLESGTMRIDAFLQMFHARLTEFRVSNSSPLCGKELAACNLPSSTLFALAFRKNEIFAPSGNTVFQPGDTVVAVVTPDVEKELEPLFPEK